VTLRMRWFGALGVGLVFAGVACGSDDEDEARELADGDPSDSPAVPVASCEDSFGESDSCSAPAGRVFYVSSSEGDDSNDGLSESSPLASITAVNDLEVEPGDQVLFRCGDVWRGEPLILTRSGAECQHIVYGSYPRTCEDQPTLSGSFPISGWESHSDDIYVADLGAGENEGAFLAGVNQLFRDDVRLPMGKWPNADDPAFDHGYSFIDRAPSSTVIEDDELPAGDWAGAVIRAKLIRWLLVSRRVQSSDDRQLTLENGLDCWGDGCGDPDPSDAETHGWGYLITHHLGTLDQEGEWTFDEEANRVYLYSATAPENIEGSAFPDDLEEEDDVWHRGAVVLGKNLEDHINYVVVENLLIKNQAGSGIATPINLQVDDNSHLVIRCNTIRNVDRIGLSLATWVWDAGDDSGWRGGHDQVISDNVIDGANEYGIHSYAYRTTFQNNLVTNTGQAQNLGKAGLGCGIGGDNCTEHGAGIHAVRDQDAFTTHSNTFRGNRIESAGGCGLGVYGHSNLIERNFIDHACSTKGDCGGVCMFGGDSLSDPRVYENTVRENIVVDTVGVTDGDSSDFKPRFGFGLYIDHHSRDITTEGNTVIGSTAAGILYQDSTGTLRDNVVYGNALDRPGGGQVVVGNSPAQIEQMSGNVLCATTEDATTLQTEPGRIDSSDDNVFFHPWREDHIWSGDNLTLAEWQAGGLDGQSRESFYSAAPGEAPRTDIFYNATGGDLTIPLEGSWLDLDEHPVSGDLVLGPFESVVLVRE